MTQKSNNTTAQCATQSEAQSAIKNGTTAQSPKSKCELMFPIGCEDFEKMRSDRFYYVDKTGLIEQLLDNRTEVTLFTRPRRFGKSLNMSMLKHFFEAGSDPALFDGLAITKRQDLCEQYMGKYPVIFLSLKRMDGKDFDTAYAGLCSEIQREANRLSFLLNSDALDSDKKALLKQFMTKSVSEDDMRDCIYSLSHFLEKHYGQKAIILIDEYDVPLDKAYVGDYYDEMVDLMRAVLGSALKSNTSLQFAVLTGCLRVSKESIFTGLNNFRVCGISDLKYTEYFGFTEPEVRKMFDDYEYEDRLEDAKKWYDGYHFGDQEIFCPWDVLNFCADLDGDHNMFPKNYWVNTSSNDIVRDLIKKADDAYLQNDIERLIEGETITKRIGENITYRDIDKNVNNLWSLLYMTGYLTTTKPPVYDSDGAVYTLRTPNLEIRQIYKNQVLEWFEERVYEESKVERESLERFYTAFEEGDEQTVEDILNDRLLTTVSFYDKGERFYHGITYLLLKLCNMWGAFSNRETGNGRSDIQIQGNRRKFGAVVELKYADGYDNLEEKCAEAIKQINDNEYTKDLRAIHVKRVLVYGIAFYKKECKVKVETAWE